MCVSHTSICGFQPVCCDSTQNKGVFYGILLGHPWRWHLLYTIPVTGSLACLHSFHCFLALFLSCALLLSLNHPPSYSLSHLSLSIFLNHLLPYYSLSTQIFHSTHPSTVSLTSYPSLSHFTPCFSPSFSILALGTVMVHSATVFISASSPEWLCLYLNIRNTFLLKRYTKKKKGKGKKRHF